MINMQGSSQETNTYDPFLEKLDVRTITMGISLLDCVDSDLAKMNERSTIDYNLCERSCIDRRAIGREFGVSDRQ